jgi:hypothetical protein
MITLLLAFFVLLQAFAQEQSPELFNQGQGSFKSAIQEFGLPLWNSGRDRRMKREWFIRRYSDDPHEEESLPIIDAEEERLQKMFQELKEKIESESAEMAEKPVRVEATPVQFGSGSVSLDRTARKYLEQLAVDLQSNLRPEDCSIYLIGLAPEERPSQKAWVLSAQRARKAAEYLHQKLERSGSGWRLYSWGGARAFGRFPEGTYLGLVVMGVNHGR